MRQAVEWCGDHLEIIDQTVLPHRLEIAKLTTPEEVVDAIRRLAVRGAPAIGVCGAFGVVLGVREGRDLAELVSFIGSARPTAVNLAWAVERVARSASTFEQALEVALSIQREDEESCRSIGEHGRIELTGVNSILTHCNTGRLATAGIGTALGIVYAKAEAGEPVHVFATESRPLLQGARLTAWELREAGIPVTLIVDGAAGAALASGRVDAVVVGCDRVACNGDVANKIGTYPLAVLANANGIPFYVAGPMSSFDPGSPTGESIRIEERGDDEVLGAGGARFAPDVAVWNPAFDITPVSLVTAFVTDAGVLRPPYGSSIAAALGPPR